MWKNKYEALAKLYSQLRQEHLDLLNKFKQLQLKANNAQEAIEKLDKMKQDMRAKNMELADMIRERDRAKNELERLRLVRNVFVWLRRVLFVCSPIKLCLFSFCYAGPPR